MARTLARVYDRVALASRSSVACVAIRRGRRTAARAGRRRRRADRARLRRATTRAAKLAARSTPRPATSPASATTRSWTAAIAARSTSCRSCRSGGYRQHLAWVDDGDDRRSTGSSPSCSTRDRAGVSLARDRVAVRALGRQAHAERVRDRLDDHLQRRGLAADERRRRARDAVPRAVSPQRRRARRLVGARRSRPTTPRSSRSAARSSNVPRAVRAERHEGARRHLLRVPAEQRRRPSTSTPPSSPSATGKSSARCAATGKLSHPAFKCGPPENARAWKALVDEFFGGTTSFRPVDRQRARLRASRPPCAGARYDPSARSRVTRSRAHRVQLSARDAVDKVS